MLNTLQLQKLEEYAENVYEAIVIISKRARQINAEARKVALANAVEEDDNFDVFSDEPDFDNVDFSQKDEPKPTTVALEEFLAGKLKYEYGTVEKLN
ncbi:DNA-directed RNA polymerase subunit omega [bacterium]|nr:DNA-directed RNA polymerase subunit omega [bacterium]